MNNNADIPMISETKIDETFPNAQFCTDRYSTSYHLLRNSNGGGNLLYVREDIPSKMLKAHLQVTFEGFFIEINFKNKSGFLVGPMIP